MKAWEWSFTYFFPVAVTLVTMVVVLFFHCKLERHTDGHKTIFSFHVVNLLILMMMYGSTFLAFHLSSTVNHVALGVKNGLIHSTIIPFPFILIVYAISAYLFRKYVRFYVIDKDSNIVVLRYNWVNRLMR
ncbi:hypothetical protein [Bacillus sp. FJAT-45350]|uniref:hypothetical protein n=1 Tax=Bacillus sp. FJAT-45350 TaxID=2011014 RepID=UPI000BB94699|nr:hypothetical protein [Bacillus sp. FJAT-45350]